MGINVWPVVDGYDEVNILTENVELQGEKPERIDHDSTWKDLIDRFFYPLLEMALPELYQDTDTTKKHSLLDKEFRDILNTSDPTIHTSPHFADYVIRVPLKKGGEEWLILHIEVQGEGGNDLPTRMFHYQSMIFDHYQKNPVALAVITDKRPEKEADYFSHSHYGTEIVYRYNKLALSDLNDDELLESDNPMALAFYAARVALQSKEEVQKYNYLYTLTELLTERGWSMEDKRDLMLFLERIINLKDVNLRHQYREYQQRLSREGKIMYVTVMDEYYLEKAKEEGIAEYQKEMVKNLLANGVAPDVIAKSAGMPIERVRTLLN